MKNLIIERTNTTPYIHFDASSNALKLEGDSRPENVEAFYEPILNWIKDFCDYRISATSKAPVTIFIQLNYYNSSSSKCIFDFLELTKVLADYSIEVNVVWTYEKDDDDMKEAGHDLQELLHINFTYNEI